MISVGIDAGAATTKTVVLRNDAILGWRIAPSGFDFAQAGRWTYDEVLADIGLSEMKVDAIYATGYGKNAISFAHKTISEITAHAQGTSFFFPEVAGIIDIGGQDSKVIAVNNGKVSNFLMNDKCAAGTGKFLEHSARSLEVTVNEMGDLALISTCPAKIASMCTVFAESEIISLRAKGYAKMDIAAGLIESIAQRIAVMARRVGLKDNVAFVGGVAKNLGMRAALEKELGIKLLIPEEPQITGAIGAALRSQTAGRSYRSRI